MVSQNYRVIILIFSLIIFSCAHKKNEVSHPLKTATPSEYLELCNKNIPLGCYFYAQHLLSEKRNDEAQTFFEKSCNKNHQPSCTNLGILYHQFNKSDLALKTSIKSCEKGDALGCYNAACFYCLKNNEKESLLYLDKSYHLGYADAEWALNDQDLNCLRKNEAFGQWISTIKSAKNQQRLSPYHITIDHWGIAFVPPQNLNANFSHPLEFTHPNQSKASIAVSSISPNELRVLMDNTLANLRSQVKDLREAKFEETEHNGYPYFVREVNYKIKDEEWILLQVVTGTPFHSVYAWGVYPRKMENEIGAQIKVPLFNLILHPDFKISFIDQKNAIKPPKKYQFAGITVQNELLYKLGNKPMTIDGTLPYFTFTENSWDEKKPLTLEEAIHYLGQIQPPYYSNMILLNRETIPFSKGKLIHFKGTSAFSQELPKTIQFDYYLLQVKNKIYTLKFFGSSQNANQKSDIFGMFHQLTKK